MPTVPRYNKPAVEPRGLPSPRTPTNLPREAFGGGRSLDRVTDAASNLVQTAGDIYEAERRKADEIAVRDADIATAELSNELETGVKAFKGKDAAKAPDYVNENWGKGLDKILPTLKTDAQRQAASRIIRARRSQLDQSAQIHMASEFKKYDDQQFESAITLYRNDGSMKYNRPGAIPQSIFQQEAEIDRYATRNNLPPEWAEAAKAKARSATYRDVLERMEVDGNHAMAKNYEKQINKHILPDDVAILEKVRKEEKARRQDLEDEFERQAYLMFKDSDDTDEQKLDAIDKMLRAGKIKVSMAEKMKGWVLQTFDDREIPIEKKVSKYNDLVESFIKLEGVEIDDDTGKPTSAASGNDFAAISAFRKEVAEAKRYLTSDQYSKFIELTEKDYDESRAPKTSIFKSLIAMLPSIPQLSPAATISLMTRGMQIFDKSVTPAQAAEQTMKLKEEAVVTGNPLRTQYPKGTVLTAGAEIKVNGRKFVIPGTMTVTGYDTDGTPILDEGIVKVKPDGN